MRLDKMDIDTLKDFVKVVDEKNRRYIEHPAEKPGLMEEVDIWLDSNGSDEVIEALGVVQGSDYLHFVPDEVLKELPVSKLNGIVLYDYRQAQKAIETGQDYPSPLSLRDLHFRARSVWAFRERLYNIAHHIEDSKPHIIHEKDVKNIK